MPLYLVTLAGWIKLVGFSVLSVRFLSVLCGAGLIGAGYIIVRKLTGSIFASLIAASLIATDYTVLLSAATARMDTMTAVFGYASLAAYLSFRERSLNKAVLFGTICAAGSLFAHPVGIIYSGGMLLAALYLDYPSRPRRTDDRRSVLQWHHLALAAIPYVAATAIWGLYYTLHRLRKCFSIK